MLLRRETDISKSFLTEIWNDTLQISDNVLQYFQFQDILRDYPTLYQRVDETGKCSVRVKLG